MRKVRSGVALGMLVSLSFQAALQAETFKPLKPKGSRTLELVREYEITVKPGEKTVVSIPAALSFWGMTNQQVIKESEFAYSVQPDAVEVTADDRGTARRFYQLTWNAPQASRISVVQKLKMELSYHCLLMTAAKLDYPDEVKTFFASSLGGGEEINIDNPEIERICADIRSRTDWAEEAVELACDWVNDHIVFKSGASQASDEIIKQGFGNCTGMSKLACAIIRRLGIPAEMVSAKFIGGNGGHAFIEVYFPDAGWIFYDLSNATRGYKSLDCIMTMGYSYRVDVDSGGEWVRGYFCRERDAGPYNAKAADGLSRRQLRKGPSNGSVAGAGVLHREPNPRFKIRHLPLRRLILENKIAPGVREYEKQAPPWQASPSGRGVMTPTGRIKSKS